MTARKYRPTLEALEDRCTPSGFSFTAALGHGHSAVSLFIDVQHPPSPIAPETVTISRLLPNGVIQEFPATPIAPPNPCDSASCSALLPIYDLFPPGPYRGWLQAADISSDVFIVPTTTGDGGVLPTGST
jgi:hypothetical protein